MPAMLHQGDCLDVLKTLPADSIHSVVTDPPYGLALMNKHWDYDVPSVAIWTEVLRVLRPGGHLLSFSSTRTYHRMVVAIEDAGFEIRDQIGWLYGSGFPKSHNLDGKWEGWGTALKPAWEPICLARKPLTGTVAENMAAHGTGAIDIDASRIAGDGSHMRGVTTKRTTVSGDERQGAALGMYGAGASFTPKNSPLGRWPANVIHDGSDEVLDAFAAFGEKSSGKPGVRRKPHETHSMAGRLAQTGEIETGYADSGSAARFFYCAKASTKDRQGSKHPTVKPVSLMRYLVRLVTPQGGIVLDPFAGTGTTGQAAVEEGCDAILIERESEYCDDIRHRLSLFLQNEPLSSVHACGRGTLQ